MCQECGDEFCGGECLTYQYSHFEVFLSSIWKAPCFAFLNSSFPEDCSKLIDSLRGTTVKFLSLANPADWLKTRSKEGLREVCKSQKHKGRPMAIGHVVVEKPVAVCQTPCWEIDATAQRILQIQSTLHYRLYSTTMVKYIFFLLLLNYRSTVAD